MHQHATCKSMEQKGGQCKILHVFRPCSREKSEGEKEKAHFTKNQMIFLFMPPEPIGSPAVFSWSWLFCAKVLTLM